eukprot:1154476-Pelagomonas_calceolata.AAC.3
MPCARASARGVTTGHTLNCFWHLLKACTAFLYTFVEVLGFKEAYHLSRAGRIIKQLNQVFPIRVTSSRSVSPRPVAISKINDARTSTMNA